MEKRALRLRPRFKLSQKMETRKIFLKKCKGAQKKEKFSNYRSKKNCGFKRLQWSRKKTGIYLLFWTKLIEYPPVLGSCCIWKLLVDKPKGRRIEFPISLSLPSISVFNFSFRSFISPGNLYKEGKNILVTKQNSR